MKVVLLILIATVVVNGAPGVKKPRQDNVTIIAAATNPSVVTPELVPAVIDPLPITTTTVKPNVTKVEEDSSEEDEDEGDEDEEEDEEDEEENRGRRNEITYIPGYITDEGELLVPIDTISKDLKYTIIEDPFRGRRQQGGGVGGGGGGGGVVNDGDVNVVKEKDEDEDEEEEDKKKNPTPQPQVIKPPPLSHTPSQLTNEDDELENNNKNLRSFY